MNYFKEYDGAQKKMSRWLPWACLVSPSVVENKDGSFVGAFSYTVKKNGDNQTALQTVREFIHKFGSGWVWWVERRYAPDGFKNHIAISWNPKLENDRLVNYPREFDLPKDNAAPQPAFAYALNWLENALGDLVNIRQLRDLALLQFLHDTVTPDSIGIAMPEVPMYLDAQLSQNNSYSISNCGLRVNSNHLKIISLLSFMEEPHALFAFLEKRQYKYRFVRRLVFFSMEDAQKEAKRYMNGWCEGRRSILSALDYAYNADQIRGYLANTLILWHEKPEVLAKICGAIDAYLADRNIVSVFEAFNQVDIWMGSLPAMFRSNIKPPIAELDDAALLIF